AGDALFGLVGPQWGPYKVEAEVAAIVLLIVMNLRGVKESVKVLLPIFLIFLVVHILLIGGTLVLNASGADDVALEVVTQVRSDLNDPKLGWLGVISLLL